ncbi:MAG: hypothetical protein QM754_08205 [Tepidisphaeraceae bacterium]
MPAPGQPPARRSAIGNFLGRPTLGGWLAIGNSVGCLTIVANFALPICADPPDVVFFALVITYIALTFPLAFILWLPTFGRGPSPLSAVIACALTGLNSFVWGYALAAIIRRLRRLFTARTATPTDPPAVDPAAPGQSRRRGPVR